VHRIKKRPAGNKSGIIYSVELANHGQVDWSFGRRNVECFFLRHVSIAPAYPYDAIVADRGHFGE
jgi:hypothetical protein